VDDCVGALDECGICNGPGAIYECGCTDIAEGDCDCDGNQLDALGECGGDCAADADGNGVCDDAEVLGCMNACACNYDSAATQDDGNCEYASCTGCIYATADNYNAEAKLDDGSCTWSGCTDDEFLNYNSYATNDFACSNIPGSADLNGDGEVDASDLIDFLTVYGTQSDELYGSNFGSQCLTDALGVDELESIVCSGCCPESGCMYSTAMNFDPAATLDAGSCVFGGCTDQAAQNYNALANEDDNSCLYEVCPDFTGDGEVTLMDFLAFLVGYIGEGLNVDTNDGGDADDGGGMNTLVGDGN